MEFHNISKLSKVLFYSKVYQLGGTTEELVRAQLDVLSYTHNVILKAGQ